MSKSNFRKRQAEDLKIATSVVASFSDERLLEVQGFVDDLLEFRKVKKLRDTYSDGIKTSLENTGNGRIYVTYNLDGAVTGRLSNSGMNITPNRKKEGKIGVSFHTLPREQEDFNIRNVVIAPPGYKFITADKKAMELRILAHVADEKNMIKAFEDGLDLHTYSASMTFNKDPEDITKLERQISKEVSFLTVYGGTASTLANKRGISEHKAQTIIDNWMAAFPRVPVYMATVREYIEEHEYINTIFGRRRHLPNIKSPFRKVREEAYRQGLNFTIQSPASDVLLCSMLGIDEAIRSRGMKATIVATVHDSVEMICPDEEVDDLLKIVYSQMVNYPYLRKYFGMELKVPLDIDIEVGTSFGNGERVEFD